MKAADGLREVVASSWAQKVSSGIVLLLTAAMCLVTIMTLGKSTVAAETIREELDAPQSRRIAVERSAETPAFEPELVARLSALGDVDVAVGVGGAQDHYNGILGNGGDPIPVRVLTGDWSDIVTLETGRAPRPGEVILPSALSRQVGFAETYGALVDRDGAEKPVVGTFSSRGLIPDLESTGLVMADGQDVDRLYVLATSSSTVSRLAPMIRNYLAGGRFSNAIFELPDDVTEVAASISAEFGDFSASLLAAILALGGLLISGTVFGGVISRSTDLGRRRVLGASRLLLVGIVSGSTVVPAVVGSAAGSLLGVALASRGGAIPDWEFMAAVAGLAVVAAMVASIPPALFSAFRDPVLVLRHG